MNRKQRRTAAKVATKGGKAGASASAMADAVVQKAIAAAQAGALGEAEGALDEVLARYPDHVEALHHKGMLLARGEHLDDGIALLRRVVGIKPDESLYWNNLAAAELTAGRPALALDAAQAAVRIEPKYVMAWQNLAVCLGDLARPREQADALKRVVQLAPKDADNWSQLGLAELEAGDLAAAELAFREALKRAPQNADHLSNLGVLLVQRNRPADALPHLEASLALDPNRFTATLHFGLALAIGGDRVKALRWLRRATSIKSRSHEAWGALADVAMASGENAEAIDAARRAAMIAPENAVHRHRLGRFQGRPAPVAPQTPVAESADLASSLDQIFIR